MSGSARTSLLMALRPHTRLVVWLVLLAVYVGILVAASDPSLALYAGPTLAVGALLDLVAHRYATEGRPRRALVALAYLFFAVSIALSLLSIVRPHLGR